MRHPKAVEDTTAFLNAVFSNGALAAEGACVNFRGLGHRSGVAPQNMFRHQVSGDAAWHVADLLEGWSADRSVYVAPGIRQGAIGTKDGVTSITSLWADLDAKQILGRGGLTQAERGEGKRRALD